MQQSRRLLQQSNSHIEQWGRNIINQRPLSFKEKITKSPLTKFAHTFGFNEKNVIEGHYNGCTHPGSMYIFALQNSFTNSLASDGYDADFSPPSPFVLRMWGGGKINFKRTFFVDEDIKRKSSVRNVQLKQGKSGNLCFVTVRNTFVSQSYSTICGESEILIDEEVNFVYRQKLEDDAKQQQTSSLSTLQFPFDRNSPDVFTGLDNIELSAILLFRFSSLTWNAHRIHYDKEYAQGEGYDNTLTHGPLSAVLLMELVCQKLDDIGNKKMLQFSYKALRPLLCNQKVNFKGLLSNNSSNGSEDGDKASLDVWIEDKQDPTIVYVVGHAILGRL